MEEDVAMFRFAAVAAFAAISLLPAAAQNDLTLLRVYIDAPYFYDILASNIEADDPQAIKLDLLVEGKEVGASSMLYSCKTGDYSETVVDEWSGNAANYIPAALMAFHDLYC